MKTLLLMVFACTLCATAEDLESMGFIRRNQPNPYQEMVTRQAAAQALEEAQKEFVPADPYRLINGEIRYAKGENWVQFSGVVLGREGARTFVKGWFGKPLAYAKMDRVFCVSNLPPRFAAGDIPPDWCLTALTMPYATKYAAADTGETSCPWLDYGTVKTAPPATPEQVAAAKQAAAARQAVQAQKAAAARARALQFNQEAADRGDPVGLVRMAERYRDGEGVPKDLAKAREYFTKAIAAGEPSAQKEMDALP